jgi:hypothetical protein
MPRNKSTLEYDTLLFDFVDFVHHQTNVGNFSPIWDHCLHKRNRSLCRDTKP